jgi:hypothetical protein
LDTTVDNGIFGGRLAKTEGSLHKLHKQTVAQELQNQNYGIHFEPWESPLNLLWWRSYKPDILAVKQSSSSQRIILVECETNPSRKRVLSKTKQIQKNLSVQKQLFENTLILPLLVIPPNNLRKVLFSAVQKFWEIWIISLEGQIEHKIPRNQGLALLALWTADQARVT